MQEICVSCKTKIVDFFIFKRRNEETRRIYETSTSPKNILLQFVDQLENMPQDTEIEVHDTEELPHDNETEEREEFVVNHEEIAIDDDSVHGDEFCDDLEYDGPEEEHVIVTTEVETKKMPSPAKLKVARKSNPDTWKRNTRKLAKNTGQAYVTSNGKVVEAKRMKDTCGSTCRMQCASKISEASRLENFKHFYRLADIAKQRRFLFDHMRTFEPRHHKNLTTSKNSRSVQRNYFLELTHPNGAVELVQVCKLLFLNTFCISSQMIDTLYRKAFTEGRFCDVRGKFERRGGTKSQIREAVDAILPVDQS